MEFAFNCESQLKIVSSSLNEWCQMPKWLRRTTNATSTGWFEHHELLSYRCGHALVITLKVNCTFEEKRTKKKSVVTHTTSCNFFPSCHPSLLNFKNARRYKSKKRVLWPSIHAAIKSFNGAIQSLYLEECCRDPVSGVYSTIRMKMKGTHHGGIFTTWFKEPAGFFGDIYGDNWAVSLLFFMFVTSASELLEMIPWLSSTWPFTLTLQCPQPSNDSTVP